MHSNFAAFGHEMPTWLSGAGEAADIVICSRARLSRNVAGLPFPGRSTPAAALTVRADLSRRLRRLPTLRSATSFDLDDLEPTARRVLYEKMLVPHRLLGASAGRGLLLSETQNLAVLLNDEDHLRLSAFRAGLDPHGALAGVMALDREIETEVEAAFSPEWGYLTASPANVGTGLRLSALLHLPGLVMIGEIEKVLNALRQLQFAVRGMFGQTEAVRGAIFQIGNLITLGRDEREIAADFFGHLRKIVVYERAARDQIYGRDHLALDDLVWRSWAALSSARLITAQETFDFLSHVRLGVGLGILPVPARGALNRLMVQQQTAHLELDAGHSLVGIAANAARAVLLREHFAV